MSINNPEPSDMDITVMSAEGLKQPSCFIFSKPLRPFITLKAMTPSTPWCVARNNGSEEEDRVGLNWGDEFHVDVSSSFFTDLNASIHLQLYRKGFTHGWTQLGWCRVPVTDIVLPSVDSVKYLSYRLLDRDGTRSDGIINLAVKVGVSLDTHEKWPSDDGRIVTSQTGGTSDTHDKWSSSSSSRAETSRTVIGIPAKYF
ncbi:hypothetical protein BT93_E0322 [Corymbia citriodora subsp. variegata]|nr:hypothetical protein BT93_E0322 [Corymbia citriodora subsp. variegata]